MSTRTRDGAGTVRSSHTSRARGPCRGIPWRSNQLSGTRRRHALMPAAPGRAHRGAQASPEAPLDSGVGRAGRPFRHCLPVQLRSAVQPGRGTRRGPREDRGTQDHPQDDSRRPGRSLGRQKQMGLTRPVDLDTPGKTKSIWMKRPRGSREILAKLVVWLYGQGHPGTTVCRPHSYGLHARLHPGRGLHRSRADRVWR